MRLLDDAPSLPYYGHVQNRLDWDAMDPRRIIEHPFATPEALDQVTGSHLMLLEPAVLQLLATHPQLSADAAKVLARRPDVTLSRLVQRHPHYPYADTVHAYAPNPLAHPDVPLERLYATVGVVRRDLPPYCAAALTNPSLPVELRARWVDECARGHSFGIAQTLATNPNLTQTEADQFVDHYHLGALWAKHPHASSAWLNNRADQLLARTDAGAAQLADVAAHPHTPTAVLPTLARTVGGYGVLTHPKADEYTLLTASIRWGHRHHSQTTLWYHSHAERLLLDNLSVAPLVPSQAPRHFCVPTLAAAHATSFTHADILLALGPAWSGSCWELLETARGLVA